MKINIPGKRYLSLTSESWESSRFNFQDWVNVKHEWVPELNMVVGAAISALKKTWKRWKFSREAGYNTEELEARINLIQHCLGLEETKFY